MVCQTLKEPRFGHIVPSENKETKRDARHQGARSPSYIIDYSLDFHHQNLCLAGFLSKARLRGAQQVSDCRRGGRSSSAYPTTARAQRQKCHVVELPTQRALAVWAESRASSLLPAAAPWRTAGQ